jgi:hypothetical protein
MTNSLSRRLTVGTALLALATSGCVPGVSWLPDSSGFVDTGGKGKKQLLLFEVATKKGRVLVADVGGPGRPAVSPDGKRIALGRWLGKGWQELVVDVFDRTGKRIHRSGNLCQNEPTRSGLPQVAWSPRGDKLVVGYLPGTAIYDLKAHKRSASVKGALVAFGDSPVRPDGKGFLIATRTGGYSLVDWQGKERPIKGNYDKLAQTEPGERKGTMPQEVLLAYPMLSPSRWDGPVASFFTSTLAGRLDTDRLSVVAQERKPARTADGYLILQSHAFPRGATVRMVARSETAHRLEVLRPGARKAEVLVPKAGFLKLFPSPDGKFLAVRWAGEVEWLYSPAAERVPHDRLLVLDARGDVLSNQPVGE